MMQDENMLVSINEQQAIMLRLFQKPLPQEDFLLMQQLAVKLLAKQLDEEVEDWEKAKGLKLEDLARNPFRSTTKY